MKTYVPKELMTDGWQTRINDREIKNNWKVERDVFTWLNEETPIEDVIERYSERLNEGLPKKGKIKGFFLRLQWGTCHHGVNDFIKRCPTCDKQDRECINYLKNLKNKVRKYNEKKSFDDFKDIQRPIEQNDRTLIYARVLQISGEITESAIKKNYRQLVSKYHPDKVNHLGVEIKVVAEKKMKELNEARGYLIQFLKNTK